MEFATFPRRREHLITRADGKPGFFQEHVRISCFEEANLSIKLLVDANGAISSEGGKDVRVYGFFLRKMITFLLELYLEANKHEGILLFKFDSNHDVIPLKRYLDRDNIYMYIVTFSCNFLYKRQVFLFCYCLL